MQRTVNATIEKEVFSVWFQYVYQLLDNGCVFMGVPRDYISSAEPNQRMRMGRALGSQGRRGQLKIDCKSIHQSKPCL
jgi:hypothetical protein